MALSSSKVYNGGKINPDLQKERDTATFDPDALMYFLHDGKEKYDRKKELG